MARQRYGFDEAKIARWLKAGRGSGRGSSYKPWLEVKDVPSHGRSARVVGWRTNRLHHFLSDLEFKLFLLHDWSEATFDLREQFPLNRQETIEIAKALGVKHPTDRETGAHLVMTTDLIVDRISGAEQPSVAMAVKPAKALDEQRTLEKLEIERRYWASRKVTWRIVTEHELALPLIKTIEVIHSERSADGLGLPDGIGLVDIEAAIRSEAAHSRGRDIGRLCADLDSIFRSAPGTCLRILKHMLACKRLTFPDTEVFSPQAFASLIGFQDFEAERLAG